MPRVKRAYAKRAGIIEDDDEWSDKVDKKFDFLIAGPNHFTWLLKAEYDGKDVIPAIADALRQSAATETDGGDKGSKAKYNATITYDLYRTLGCVPTCVGHTKEYVRFWQGLGKTPEPIEPLSIWDTAARYERHADMWSQVDGFNNGTTPIAEYMTSFGPDHATDIIEAMWGELKKPFFINTANEGALANMPDDAFVEVLCDVSMDAPVPRPIGDAPVGLRGLWQQVLDSHELSVRAAMSGDRDLLLRAFVCDPMVSSIADSEKIIEELLELERDALPDYWF
jgi:alpha-galactosidase